jgi:hypothetical protein
VQEVLYARSARIICGSRSLDLADFQGAEDSLHLWVWNLYSVLSSVLQLEEMRTRLALFNGQNPTQSLEQALIVLRERYCTDPKDWIYAILNVAKSGCFGIKPDYSKSTQLIYAEAAKVLIADSRSLDSITLWKGPHAHQKYGHQPVDNLPTWTPDFSTLASSGFHQSTKSQTMSESTRLYSADKGTIARPFEVSKKGDIADVLNVQAASIGIVKNVSICGSHHLGSSIVETWARLAHQAEMNSPRNTFLETWTLLSQQSGTYPTGETIPEAFCRTCLKDINDYSLSKKTSTPFQPNLAYSRLQKEHLPALLKGLQHAMLNNDQSIASSAEFLKRIGGPDEPNHQVFFTTEGGLFWLDACGCGNWG